MTTHPYEDTDTGEQPGVAATDDSEAEAGSALDVALTWLRKHRKRLIKFGAVGALGVLVNEIFFELGIFAASGLGQYWAETIGLTLGIVVSIFANFVLNDFWTWGDRAKQGGLRGWAGRMVKYYIGASVAAVVQFIVYWISRETLWAPLGWEWPGGPLPVVGIELPAFPLAPRLSLLTGIAAGMAINFLVGHLWAFREADDQSA